MLVHSNRTITLLWPDDDDDDPPATGGAFQRVQQQGAASCDYHGRRLRALALRRACYREILGPLHSHLTCSASRLPAGAYASARSNGKPAQQPVAFRRAHDLFPVSKRGRAADFRTDGTPSSWTVAGRKRIAYTVPDACKATMIGALEMDSLNAVACSGKLFGGVTLTLEAPEPSGMHPVGMDLNETNALVAVGPRRHDTLCEWHGRDNSPG